jgi:hypothetical protein
LEQPAHDDDPACNAVEFVEAQGLLLDGSTCALVCPAKCAVELSQFGNNVI